MSEKNIGALLVMEGEEVVGIITERDYARKIILMSRSSKETPVRSAAGIASVSVSLDHRDSPLQTRCAKESTAALWISGCGGVTGCYGVVFDRTFTVPDWQVCVRLPS